MSSAGSARNNKASSKEILAPKTEHYEFGGPIGALGVSLMTPFFSYLLFYACNEQIGCALLPKNPSLIFQSMGQGIIDSFSDLQGWTIYFAWYAFTVLAWAIIPERRSRASRFAPAIA